MYKTFKMFNSNILFKKPKYKKNYKVAVFTWDNIITFKLYIGQFTVILKTTELNYFFRRWIVYVVI